jgi:hypothetical protein
MNKSRYLVEASFEVLATSKEQAEEILSAFIQRYINQKPRPLEIMTGEIAEEFHITESTFALDHNVEDEKEYHGKPCSIDCEIEGPCGQGNCNG